MKQRNLCLQCPDGVRGMCCYMSELIHDHNVVLEAHPCKMLNIETGLCRDYENRFKIPHCKNGLNKFNIGALPKECLYLKGKEIEHPKVKAEDVIQEFTPEEVMYLNRLNMIYNLWDLYYEVEGLKA